MLELKSLLVGLVFAVGVFALKTGAGLTYLVAQKSSGLRKIAVLFGIATGYFTIFLFSWYVCSRVDVVYYFNRLRVLFQSGMTLHVIVAMGMFIWGWSLLRRNPKDAVHDSMGWVALVIPCPVCGSVIFFTTGFLVSFFPDDSLRAVVGTYALFAVIVLVTVGTLSVASRVARWQPEQVLAYSMLFIASYFVLSILVAPHFNDFDEVYRLASFQSSHGSVDPRELAELLMIAGTAICAGFLLQRLRQRSVR